MLKEWFLADPKVGQLISKKKGGGGITFVIKCEKARVLNSPKKPIS